MQGSPSRRLTSTIVFLSLGCFLAPEAHAIRYELINEGAGAQNGHTLIGFIEFDSACGEICNYKNIVDFTFTVSGPNNYSYSFQREYDAIFTQNNGNAPFLVAGPQFLTISVRTPNGFLILQDFSANGIPGGSEPGKPYIEWFKAPLDNTGYFSVGPDGQVAWFDRLAFVREYVIGKVVPEPAICVLSMLCTLLLAFRPWMHTNTF